MIDTHAHIYSTEFDQDIDLVLGLAKDIGITKILMPNIDLDSYPKMMALAENHPNFCFPMAGIHPCYLKSDFEAVLSEAYKWLKTGKFVGVGETGIDLYWDKTFIEEQKISFAQHLKWGVEFDLPVIVHIRDSFDEVFEVVEQYHQANLKGIFHCFTGTLEQANRANELGFKLGIGGVITYKNSHLPEVVKQLDIRNLVLETDSPYLPPTPFRGKRNEPAFISNVAHKLAEIKEISIEEVSEITTHNALTLFKLN